MRAKVSNRSIENSACELVDTSQGLASKSSFPRVDQLVCRHVAGATCSAVALPFDG